MLWSFIKNKMLDRPGKRLCEDNVSITYEESVIFAESFARKLNAPCCTILCHSEMAAALALLSCFAAGVTAIPLSYRYGESHIRKIFTAIKPACVISDIGGELQVINLGSDRPFDDSCPALIMCTSGTTGDPKGIMLSEENLITNIKDIRSYFDIGEKDKILIARPLYHCAVLTGEFLISLIRGLDIVFISDKFDPNKLLSMIEEYGVTVMGGTPTLYYILCRFLKKESPGRNQSREFTLRKIVLSGEVLNKNCAERIREAFPTAEIYHVYGLTEASPRVSYLLPEYFDEFAEYVGVPLPSVRVKIVDDNGKTVTQGADGELCVKGNSVMMGYYNAERRIGSNAVSKDGWLRTGDVASIDGTGFIKIKCRKDDLIIRAGMNIYPQEIENTLKTDSRVEEVVAFGIPDDMCGQRIGLKVKGIFENKDEVLRLCREVLPAYSQPTVIELTDEIAKSGSGKLIRRETL